MLIHWACAKVCHRHAYRHRWAGGESHRSTRACLSWPVMRALVCSGARCEYVRHDGRAHSRHHRPEAEEAPGHILQRNSNPGRYPAAPGAFLPPAPHPCSRSCPHAQTLFSTAYAAGPPHSPFLSLFFALIRSSRAEPSRAEPSRAEPSRAEPSRAEHSPAVPHPAPSFASINRPQLCLRLLYAAAQAYEHKRPQLATFLLDHEPRAADQAPVAPGALQRRSAASLGL